MQSNRGLIIVNRSILARAKLSTSYPLPLTALVSSNAPPFRFEHPRPRGVGRIAAAVTQAQIENIRIRGRPRD